MNSTTLFLAQLDRVMVIVEAAEAYKLGLTRPRQSEVHTQPTSRVRLRDAEYVDRHVMRIRDALNSVSCMLKARPTQPSLVDMVDSIYVEQRNLWQIPTLNSITEQLKESLDKLENLVDTRDGKTLPVVCLTCGEPQERVVKDQTVNCKYCGSDFNVLEGKYAAQQRARNVLAGLRLINRLKG